MIFFIACRSSLKNLVGKRKRPPIVVVGSFAACGYVSEAEIISQTHRQMIREVIAQNNWNSPIIVVEILKR
jgi:hypothetical protein